MAVRIKLGGYETMTGDPLGRVHVGYFPRITEDEAWQAGRGLWKMSRDKAGRERFAIITGEGITRAIAEITGHTVHETPGGVRVALEGRLLPAGHPVREAYLGEPDPVVNGSQNPVGYCDLPEETAFRTRACACGCGATNDRDFLPGHDVRAIQQRVRDHFGGSPLAFLRFVDARVPGSGEEGGGR